LLAACIVTTLLGGGFYSLWRNKEQVMPAFMFGGLEDWYQRTFGKNFSNAVQEVSKDEIAQIYMTILAGKPEDRKRYLEELSLIHLAKGPLLAAANQWRVRNKRTSFGSSNIPANGDVVTLIDGRELLVQETLEEIGMKLWLVDLGEIPSYAIVPSDADGHWNEVETAVA
jgi:hypothetical protein